MKATRRLIDSVWTLEYEIVSPTEIEIIRYSREDERGYLLEKELPQCGLVEDEKRTITDVLIRQNYEPFSWVNESNADVAYKVTNPKYIFDYGA